MRLQVYLDGRWAALGSWRWADQEQGLLCDWLGEQIWFSLVGPSWK